MKKQLLSGNLFVAGLFISTLLSGQFQPKTDINREIPSFIPGIIKEFNHNHYIHLSNSMDNNKKNINAARYAMDSILFYDYDPITKALSNKFKHLFSYQDNNEVFIYFDWNINRWDTLFIESRSYDSEDRLTMRSFFLTQAEMQEYSEKIDYSYENGKLVREVQYAWVEGIWKNVLKKEYTYETHGGIQSVLSYNLSNDQWEEGKKMFYSYNSNDDVSQILETGMDYNSDGIFNDTIRTEFAYGPNLMLISEIRIFYGNPGFQGKNKIEYHYDESLRLTERINSSSGDDVWANSNKTAYNYNLTGKLIMIIDSVWENNAWVPDEKEEYFFDLNQNKYKLEESEWDNTLMSWKETYKEEYVYDNSIGFQDMILPAFLIEDSTIANVFNHMVLSGDIMDWDWEIEEYVYSKVSMFYSDLLSSHTPSNTSSQPELYPNPVREVLHIGNLSYDGLAGFELFDLQGRCLKKLEVRSGSPVYLDGLQEGVYFYRLSQGTEIQSGKIIKQ